MDDGAWGLNTWMMEREAFPSTSLGAGSRANTFPGSL
jgi:hypothetical protein